MTMEADDGGHPGQERPVPRQQQGFPQQGPLAVGDPPIAGAGSAAGAVSAALAPAVARQQQHAAAAATAAQHQEDEEEEPLLVKPMTCSYSELLSLIQTLDFRGKSSSGPAASTAPPTCTSAGHNGSSTTTPTVGHSRPVKRQKYQTGHDSNDDKKDPIPLLLLPPELCVRVLQFLTIQRVDPSQVVAVGSSSHDRVHPLSCCLSENERTWWISESGSMPRGLGAEWVQFALAVQQSVSSSTEENSKASSVNRTKSRLCRLSYVSMIIPPLPQGPLSVLEFCIQRFCNKKGEWCNVIDETDAATAVSNTSNQPSVAVPNNNINGQANTSTERRTFLLENRTGWQRFHLPNQVDVDEVRIVCLRNQISPSLERIHNQTTVEEAAAAGDPRRVRAGINNPNHPLIPLQQRFYSASRFYSVGFIAVRFE